MRYQTAPYDYLHDYGMFFEYRWAQNTYVQATWKHDRPSHFAPHGDVDSLGLGIGLLFRFGGITLNATGDTYKNLSIGLTYNISFGPRMDRVVGQIDMPINKGFYRIQTPIVISD